MNPQLATCPEVIDQRLCEGHAVCSSFNSRGTLLAVGCHDGRILIWDFDVIGVSRVLFGHVRPITSLCWSKRHLLSSSSDWTVIWWDLLSAEIIKKFRFDSPVLSAHLHSRKPLALISAFMEVFLFPFLSSLFILIETYSISSIACPNIESYNK
jgi:COMPASS component SWD1